MHTKFLPLLKCPETDENLTLVTNEEKDGMTKTGYLENISKTQQYPIINFIPRFVDKELYSSSFGYEWKKWPKVQFESENVGKPMEKYTSNMFYRTTGIKDEDMKDKTVVEFGCGPGRFLDIVRTAGGMAVGIDMSIAVECARENFQADENVLIVQGDVLNPPFKDNSFDHGYTIGVLHHTNNPALGLKKLVNIVKKEGKVACCVYSKKSLYNYFSVLMFRKIHYFLTKIFQDLLVKKLYVAYSYFSAYILYNIFNPLRKIKLTRKIVSFIDRFLLVTIYIPDAKWRILDTFDAITPYYASTHTSKEISDWYEKAGIDNIKQTRGDSSYVGIK